MSKNEWCSSYDQFLIEVSNLRSIVNRYVENGVISSDFLEILPIGCPTDYRARPVPPSYTNRYQHFLREGKLRKLLMDRAPRVYLYLVITQHVGLGEEESLILEWSDVSNDCLIRTRYVWTGEPQTGLLKESYSIPLSGFAQEAFELWKVHQKKMGCKSEWVFPNKVGNYHLSYDYFQRKILKPTIYKISRL